MLLSIPASLYYGGEDLTAIVVSSVITISIGFIVWRENRSEENAEIKKREGYLVVFLGWLSMSVFGTMPYLISGAIPNVAEAFFESISGFTTTGASILTDIESLPKGILFWRSTTQWIGGLGIIVLTIAILPLLGIGGMELFAAEAPGPTKDKIHPRIKETAKRLWAIYIAMTLTEVALLYIAGMSLYDAFCHAFTTCSTGGFSTKNASISAFNNPVYETIIIIFMFLAGTNFNLIYFGIKGRFDKIKNNDEFKWYLIWVIALILILTPVIVYNVKVDFLTAFRQAAFQVVSIVTTTGYATADYEIWGGFALTVFFLLLFSGGSAGSTSGSIKIVRIALLAKNTINEFKRRLHPKAVIPVKMDKTIVHQSIIYNLMAFIFLYLLVFVIGSVIMASFGLDILTASSAVATSLGNVGPGIGTIGPTENFHHLPDLGKVFLGFLMLVGRLELFTVILIFTPYFWKRG
ncbi:MAG: TrkH family potassium uptake protein [Bacteroidetes bacterium]|nr:MAG: TrkH family potassium uptake protein [Bacteroidota bacterium]